MNFRLRQSSLKKIPQRVASFGLEKLEKLTRSVTTGGVVYKQWETGAAIDANVKILSMPHELASTTITLTAS